jgi:hypothetical protein
MRRAALLAALAALTVGPAAALAGGEGTGAGSGGEKSKIVIKRLNASGAKGKVTSKAAKCENRRKVTLFFVEDFVSVKKEITRTDGNGNWRTKKDLTPGEYFAKVDSIAGCRYDVSKPEQL